MSLHPSTFEYLKPTNVQTRRMNTLREGFAAFADVLNVELPDGSDKTYAIRKLREVSMWCNIALTRMADGAPRPDSTLPYFHIEDEMAAAAEKIHSEMDKALAMIRAPDGAHEKPPITLQEVHDDIHHPPSC